MHYWMLPVMPWLITLHWQRMVWQAALPPAPNAAPLPSAEIIPFPTRLRRAASA